MWIIYKAPWDYSGFYFILVISESDLAKYQGIVIDTKLKWAKQKKWSEVFYLEKYKKGLSDLLLETI